MAALLSIGGSAQTQVGRHRLADGEARTAVLFVRVTPGEKALLDARVKQTGMSGSVLVRYALLQFLPHASPAGEGSAAVAS